MEENDKDTLDHPEEVEEQVEETTEEVETSTEEATDVETPQTETDEARLARLERQAKRLKKKLGIVDEPVVVDKPKPKAKPAKQDTTLDIEAKILKVAKGFSDEEIARAKQIAVLEEIDITSAISHDLFTSWKDRRDKEADAELRASRGGVVKRKEKTFSTPGLSREEHKALFEKRMRQ